MIIYTERLIKSQSEMIRKLQEENKELRRKLAHYKNMREIRKMLGMRII
jgi:hypothetical protein